MKAALTIILFCCITSVSYGQAWVWEKPIDYGGAIATDPNNNIIIFSSNGIITHVSKYTQDGILIWHKLLSKATTTTGTGSVTVDHNGEIYFYSNGFDSVDHVFTGVKLMGVTKLSANGNVLWHVKYDATGSSPFATPGNASAGANKMPIQVDDNNNVYVGYSVHFSNLLVISLGSTTVNLNPNDSYFTIGSISSSGGVRWLRGFQINVSFPGWPPSLSGMSIAGNTLYVAGYGPKENIPLDNGLTLLLDRCSAWLAGFNTSTGQSKWGKSHMLIYYCNGITCTCSFPYMMANPTTGKVVLNNNINGAFIFKPQDTIYSSLSFGSPIWNSYYTIYDSLGNPVKGKTKQLVTDYFSDDEPFLGSRDKYFYTRHLDSLKKIDTGYNLIWKIKLPQPTTFFIPPNSNEMIGEYTRSGITYLAKMVDSAAVISGKTYADWNNDGIYTASTDSILSNILITTDNSAVRNLSGSDSGKYYLYATPGTYTINANSNHPYYEFLPATHLVTINQYTDTIKGKDFRLRPLFNFTDLSVNFSSFTMARPGRYAAYGVTVKNLGSTITSTTVGVRIPFLTTYNNVSGATVMVNAPDSVTLAMGNISPWQTKTAYLTLNVLPTAVLGDTLKFYAKVYPYTIDTVKTNNFDTLIQIVRGSFDPNEKEVNASKQLLSDSTKALVYTVHFQNTGNDTAFYVRIADTLSAKLDANTFNYIDASHTVTTEIKNNVLNFIFNPIALVDSNHNEPLSHGFVKFSIKPRSPVSFIDTIYNNAAIYFDFNAPVITNQAKTWFDNVALPVVLKSFVAEKQTTSVLLKFVTAGEPGLKNFIIERSADGISFSPIGTMASKGDANTGSVYAFIDPLPKQGINFYRLKMIDKDGRFTYSWIVIVQFSDNQQAVKVFPNPANDNLYINFTGNSAETYSCRLLDAEGKTIWAADVNTSIRNTFSINTSTLAEGIYFVSVKNEKADYQQKVVIKH